MVYDDWLTEPKPKYKEQKYRYGCYLMIVGSWDTNKEHDIVSIYRLGDKNPLLWCKTMAKTAASGAVALFQNIGYFDMPED